MTNAKDIDFEHNSKLIEQDKAVIHEDLDLTKFDKTFQHRIFDIFELCYKNNTDSCTLAFEYPDAILEVDFTFRAGKKELKGEE